MIKQIVAKRIKEARIQAKLSQKALAVLCGWPADNSRISHYERMHSEPAAEDMEIIAKALKKPVEWFYQDGGKAPVNAISIPILTAQGLDKNLNNTSGHIIIEKMGREPANLFAVKIPTKGMEPEFSPECFLVADKGAKSKAGDYVIARVKGSNSLILKKLEEHAASLFLTSLNTYPAIPLSDSIEILAPVIAQSLFKIYK